MTLIRAVVTGLLIATTMIASGQHAALSAQATPGDPAGTLAGTAWNAVELAGMTVQAETTAAGREPHLQFGADGRVSGSDGCNRLAGPYSTKGDAITFGMLIGTQMACLDTQEIALRFRAALKGTSHWRIAGGRLEFHGATGRPLAIFERRQTPGPSASTLDGTSWQLVRFEGGDGRALTPDDPAKYTITFEAGGNVAARVDCNRGRGSWKATADGQLDLGPLALTRAMCPQGSLHDQIARQWTNIRSFVMRDGHRFLSLMADGGIYEYAPLASKPQ